MPASMSNPTPQFAPKQDFGHACRRAAKGDAGPLPDGPVGAPSWRGAAASEDVARLQQHPAILNEAWVALRFRDCHAVRARFSRGRRQRHTQRYISVAERPVGTEPAVQRQRDRSQRRPRAICRARADVEVPAIPDVLPHAHLDRHVEPDPERHVEGDVPEAVSPRRAGPVVQRQGDRPYRSPGAIRWTGTDVDVPVVGNVLPDAHLDPHRRGVLGNAVRHPGHGQPRHHRQHGQLCQEAVTRSRECHA